MGKPKKGTKAHDEDLDDDVTSGQMGRKTVEKPGDNTNMGKKDKKKKGKTDGDDVHDDDDSITGKSDQKASDNTSKKDKKKKKGKTKDDDDDIEDDGKGDHKVADKTNDNTAAGKKDKKKKKGKARDDDDDSDDDAITGKVDHKPTEKTNDSTGVSKKDKKKKKGKAKDDDDDDDDDSEDDTVTSKPDHKPSEKISDSKAGSKKDKKKKKGKTKDDDDDDEEETDDRDISSKIKALSLQGDDEMDADAVPATATKKKKDKDKKKVKGMSAFQLLGDMDDDDDIGGGSDADQTDDDKSVKEDIVLEKVASESSKPKKKEKTKKKEKQKKPEDDDIDAIMASLEETHIEKKKGKKSKKADEDKAVDEELAASETKEVEKEEPKVVTIDDLDVDDGEYEKKRKKKGKKGAQAAEEAAKDEAGDEKKEADDEEGDDDGGTVKSAAQKRKEKRDREKQKKQQEKQKQKKPGKEEGDAGSKKEEVAGEATKAESGLEAGKSDDAAVKEGTPEGHALEGDDVEDEGKDGKKKKKKKGEKGDKEEKGKPTNKKLALLKEHLKKIQEEEQKAREEEERQRLLEEERIRKYEEQKRLEEERKMKKKLKKKEREERLKKEGKFLTEKQKQDKRRLEQMLEAMKEAGAELPSKEDVRKKKPIYTKKKKTAGQGMGDVPEKSPSPTTPTSPMEAEAPVLEVKSTTAVEERKDSLVEVEVADEKEKQEAVEVAEEVKDEWDAESVEDEEEEEDEDEDDDEEEEEVKPKAKPVPAPAKTAAPAKTVLAKPVEEESSDEDDDEDEEKDEDEEESSEESESDDELTPAERGREKVLKWAEAANKERNTDNLRAPVVCVLGHVDTGKTKILDKLRKTNVQDGEAGGITQQIGATNVPKDAILDKTKMCKEFTKQELKLPGLLIIDTPGHESFSNLRVRGTSLCDIAILVIDIMHGLEPQTIESINLLKERKTPFVVALNKVDRLYQWKPQPMADVQNTVKKQSPHTKAEFDERAQQVIVQLATEGLNAALFYENKNQREYVSLVPTSAHTGDGMGNLVALICELCQSMLAKKLMYSASLQAVVMEVKAITGIGTTIDVILINGTINEGDTIVLAGTEGPIVTQIRGLLMPQPMKELRVKNQYEHHKTVKAAQGVKVIAKDMEKALAGLPLYVAHDADEKEYYKEEVAAVLKDTLESIKVQERGVYVQASTLGSLEALLEFLKTSEIPYAGISIGPVHKRDIMKASVMLEHDSQYAVILAFDVKVEREAQEMAENLGVRIFTADIIYHLFDAFMKYRDDLKRKRQEEFKHIAVFPCKLRILPQFIFNTRDPIVMGVSVEAGFLKEGTPICVPTKEFVDLGRIASIEMNHKSVDIARQGQEICIKIMPIPGEAPKMFGRHFDETDLLVSKISRASIDAVKDHFREEMTKPDWKLMVELKKQFEIL